jgi:hypothetical protein
VQPDGHDASAVEVDARPDVAAEHAGDDDAAVRCLACQHAATRRDLAVEVAGSHVRTFRNPGGWSFQVACFRDAPGCTADGEPTTEHTWFDGYAWRYAHCAGCGRHLGWWYVSPADAFAGLIATRLRG